MYVIEFLLDSLWNGRLNIGGSRFHTTRRVLIERNNTGEDMAKELAKELVKELAKAEFRADLMAVGIMHLKKSYGPNAPEHFKFAWLSQIRRI